MTHEEEKQIQKILSEKPFMVRPRMIEYMRTVTVEEKEKAQRTHTQNNALHKWAEQIALALTEKGYDLRAVVTKMPTIDVPMNKQNVKETFFHPVIKALYNKTSTAELTKDQIDGLIDPITKVLGETFGIETQFPSDPNKLNSLIKSESEKGYTYPTDYKTPLI